MSAAEPSGPSVVFHLNTVPYESDNEDELEVDQLDSDTEPEPQPGQAQTASKPTTKPGERIPGHTLLSAVRLENMIQSEGVTGNLAISKEGLYVLSIATEDFIKRLIQAGHREASMHRKSIISYNDMATTSRQYQEFMFLRDMIPQHMTLADALALREAKERELLEENPAMGSMMPIMSARQSPEPEPGPSVPKPPKKSRPSNGKDKVNGPASANAKRTSRKVHDLQHADPAMMPPQNLQWATNPYPEPVPALEDSRRAMRNGDTVTPRPPSIPPPIINGYPPSEPSLPIRQSVSPPYQNEDMSDRESHPPPSVYPESHSHSITPPFANNQEEGTNPGWAPQFTGPASGFLRGPQATTPFGVGTPNTGRTIYSHDPRPS